MHIRYFSETALSHLKPHQGLSERYQRRAIDVTLTAKLTLAYGKYQELSWMDGRRTPLEGKRLKMYIMSMQEEVEAYKKISC